MIQRKQSLLMAMVVLIMGVAIWYFPIYSIGADVIVFVQSQWTTTIPVILSFILAFYAIFQYKARKKQFVINRLNMLINLALVVYLVFKVFNTPDIATQTGAIFPLLSVILLSLANRMIMKDERLVRAADRVR
ncbi:MAG: DUF4293 domain-containing protein [Cryomorphaceae bacterium]|nr:DUF4293 domain-containing protein [Cryomorphaceae bacterium]